MRHLARRLLLLLAAAVGSGAILVGSTASATVRPVSEHCAPNLANHLIGLGTTRQVISVQVRDAGATTAAVELWQRRATGASAACFVRVAGPYPANIGRNGTSAHHLEGDGTTPIGLFGFGSVLYGIAANPGVHYPYHRLGCGDWWDEDAASPMYNQFVHVACDREPSFATTSEALWRIAPFYDWMAVIEYNTAPIIAGKGSGIFLHVTVGQPTAGCVAIPAPDLLQTLRWLAPTDRPRIAIGTAAQLARL